MYTLRKVIILISSHIFTNSRKILIRFVITLASTILFSSCFPDSGCLTGWQVLLPSCQRDCNLQGFSSGQTPARRILQSAQLIKNISQNMIKSCPVVMSYQSIGLQAHIAIKSKPYRFLDLCQFLSICCIFP